MTNEVQDVAIFVTGVLLSAFFSGSEAALISIPTKRVKQLIEEGGSKAKALRFLSEKSNEILTTILIGNNFVNIFVSALATTIAQKHFASDAISYAVGFTTLMILIFGEIIPKNTFSINTPSNHTLQNSSPIYHKLFLLFHFP